MCGCIETGGTGARGQEGEGSAAWPIRVELFLPVRKTPDAQRRSVSSEVRNACSAERCFKLWSQKGDGDDIDPVGAGSAAKATRTLSLAKSYIAAERYDAAREKLNQVVQSYPDTPAARDAKALLDQIKDK